MAQHKAATSITIAPVQEKSGLAEFVDRYWKVAAVVVVVLVAALLYRQASRSKAEEAGVRAWDKISQATTGDNFAGSADTLVGVAAEVQDTRAAPWALYLAAAAAAQSNEYEKARSILARLRQEHPTAAVVAYRFEHEPGAPAQSDVDLLEARITAQLAWRAEHPTLFGLPELPAGSPRVKINTDRGSFVLGLYADRAPRHVENFLQLARDGSFTGMKFHRVVADRLIQSGDPNTLKEDVATWGTGEIGSSLEAEPNDLRRFAGALASGHLTGARASSGSQFQVLLADDPIADEGSVVFGKVVEGLETAKALSEAKTVEGTERPEDPATIQSTEVL